MEYKYEMEYINASVFAHISRDGILNNKDSFHLHNCFEILFILKGEMDYFIDHSVYHLQRGSLLNINTKEIHMGNINSDSEIEYAVMHFHPEIFSGINLPGINLLECFVNRNMGENNIILLEEEKIENFITEVEELTFYMNDKAYGAPAQTVLSLAKILIMINQIYQKQVPHVSKSMVTTSELLKQIISFIDAHLTSELSLDTIAKEFSFQKDYLNRVFKKETGDTLHNYIVSKRISLSVKLLAEGKTIVEASKESGFNDYAHFIRTFKKITGYTPGTILLSKR